VRRFSIRPERIAGDRVVFDADESRHLARVVRLRPGDTVIATDGRGHDYTVRLDAVGLEATGTVVAVAHGAAEPSLDVALLQGVPKAEKMDVIVRAATELGATRIVPVLCRHTVIRREAAGWRERAQRWQRVAREAAKQSRRASVPVIDVPRPLAEALAAAPAAALSLVIWERATVPLARVLAAAAARIPSARLVVGEVEAARAAGWEVTALGPRILRTETAGAAALAVLQARFGDLADGAPGRA
jgi:16S rRNA (uracil1498-N3)-methyltransferase